MTLHPTLWRTCRILAGPTRLRLLRLVVNEPGRTVSGLADAAHISLTRASQELRRLQSRGLLQANRKNCFVIYSPIPDPLVPTAKPLLAAMRSTFRTDSPETDLHVIDIATAFSHPRRLAIISELLKNSLPFKKLHLAVNIPLPSFKRHLHILMQRGMAQTTRQIWSVTPIKHPLSRCLVHILKTDTMQHPR